MISPAALVEAIKCIVTKQPQIGTLLSWEKRVLGAIGDTVPSITEMAAKVAGGKNLGVDLGRILHRMAIEAVGSEHVENDRFRTVNEALLPVIAERMASMRSQQGDDQLWLAALGAAETDQHLTLAEAAKINRFLHIASGDNGGGAGNCYRPSERV